MVGAAAVVQHRLWDEMNATVNDHSVHEPAEALLSEADGQEEQEGETEENPSGAWWGAS